MPRGSLNRDRSHGEPVYRDQRDRARMERDFVNDPYRRDEHGKCIFYLIHVKCNWYTLTNFSYQPILKMLLRTETGRERSP